MAIEIEFICKSKMRLCLSVLKDYFSSAHVDTLAVVATPKSLSVGSDDWCYYLFYSCLLDYGMKSSKYHENLINTFEKFPEIFNPTYVIIHFLKQPDNLLSIMKENIHPRYPNVALRKWLNLSKELSCYSSIMEKIRSFGSVKELEDFIRRIQGYGQKTGGLLVRLLIDSFVCNFSDKLSFIPLDRHDLEISYLNGIIPTTNLTSKQIDLLSSCFIEVGREQEVEPSVVDKYLWEIGNTFCSKSRCSLCPLQKNCKTK